MEWPTPIPITSEMSSALTFPSLSTLLSAIIAEYRATPAGVQRQQFKPVAFGSAAWTLLYSVGLLLSSWVEPLFTGEGVGAWLKLAEWSCYSIAWMGLPVGLLAALSRYRLYGLPLLVGDIREIATPPALAEATLESVTAGLHAQRGAVVADGEVLGVNAVDAEAVRDWMSARTPGPARRGKVGGVGDPSPPGGGVTWALRAGPRREGRNRLCRAA